MIIISEMRNERIRFVSQKYNSHTAMGFCHSSGNKFPQVRELGNMRSHITLPVARQDNATVRIFRVQLIKTAYCIYSPVTIFLGAQSGIIK